MFESFDKFDAMKILLWVVPGALLALFRSFAIRGAFPKISKDDVAALLIGSVVYYYILSLLVTGLEFTGATLKSHFTSTQLFFVLIVIPAIVGFLLGYLEASDAIGRALRRYGIRLPSPDSTAWETLFREMEPGSVLTVTMKDGTQVTGVWNGGWRGSASSSDTKIMDLYLGEIGKIGRRGYVPYDPQRGVYIVAGEIRSIEVVLVD